MTNYVASINLCRTLYIYVASICANFCLLVSLRKFAWLTVVFLHVISDWKFRWS